MTDLGGERGDGHGVGSGEGVRGTIPKVLLADLPPPILRVREKWQSKNGEGGGATYEMQVCFLKMTSEEAGLGSQAGGRAEDSAPA